MGHVSGPPGGSEGGAPRLGSMFGRYRIESVVGRGGMGVVVRATDTELERTVALKFVAPELLDDPGARERFMRESRLAAAIEHPNIVPIYEAGEADGTLFIAMRSIPDRTSPRSFVARRRWVGRARWPSRHSWRTRWTRRIGGAWSTGM